MICDSTSIPTVKCVSIVIRMNQAVRGLKLLIIVINPEGTGVGDHIHHLWAFNLRIQYFFDKLLQVSSLNDLNSVRFEIKNSIGKLSKENEDNRPFSGIYENVKRRSKYYLSDFTDGVRGDETWSKVISTTLFLFFLTILASTAMGVLNQKNTRGKISTYYYSLFWII